MSGATTPQFIREVVIFYAEGGEVYWVHWASRIVREALVALVRLIVPVYRSTVFNAGLVVFANACELIALNSGGKVVARGRAHQANIDRHTFWLSQRTLPASDT